MGYLHFCVLRLVCAYSVAQSTCTIENFFFWRSVNPVSSHIWHNYGLEVSWKGQDHFATELFGRAVDKHPQDLNTWFGLGLSLRRIGKCDESRIKMKQVCDLSCHSLSVLENLLKYMNLKCSDEGINLYCVFYRTGVGSDTEAGG
jgi:hypothetical protein